MGWARDDGGRENSGAIADGDEVETWVVIGADSEEHRPVGEH